MRLRQIIKIFFYQLNKSKNHIPKIIKKKEISGLKNTFFHKRERESIIISFNLVVRTFKRDLGQMKYLGNKIIQSIIFDTKIMEKCVFVVRSEIARFKERKR